MTEIQIDIQKTLLLKLNLKEVPQLRIIISDNCSGIEVKPGKPMVIFGSQKRNDPATNGMFGMGMFSFFSLCDKMRVETTRENSNKLYTYEITKDIFNGSK